MDRATRYLCRRRLGAGAAASAWLALALPALAQDEVDRLMGLSLEQLARVEITTVAKRPQALAAAPSAVFVITSADIRRSGATSLAEVLRLAPNLQVGRVDGRDYAISARGLNSFETANKLLVLVDGRSVQSPLYSGVEWDAQLVDLDDVERIEVVSGPAGALWGANAVNGVVNVITRPAADTPGLEGSVHVGDVDRRVSLRYGASLGEAGDYRVYLAAFEQGPTLRATGQEAPDGWRGVQGGFRTDLRVGPGALTLQGDLYDAPLDDLFLPGERLRGGNLLGRWQAPLHGGQAEVQAYYDNARRVARGVFESTETYDVEARYGRVFGAHSLVLGGGYRTSRDHFINRINIAVLDPASRTVNLANLFAQDDIALTPTVTLTAGIKFEDSSYHGAEWAPNLRLAWRPAEAHLLWAAVSRAIRSPSRIERELIIPPFVAKGEFGAESLVAYEAGYRGRPAPWISVSASAFYNTYDDLRTNALTPVTIIPVVVANGAEGSAWGVEIWGDVEPVRRWRLGLGLSTLAKDFRVKPGQVDISNLKAAGDDPDYQLLLRSQMALTDRLELNLLMRMVDELPAPFVDGYVEADARLAWRVDDHVELAVGGRNLLEESHPETAEPRSTEVRRSLYLEARWRY